MNSELISHDLRNKGRQTIHPSSLVHRHSSIVLPLAFCLMILCSFVIIPAGCSTMRASQSRLDGESWGIMKLWYSQPAKEWTEALPVGNGRLGAMIFGGPSQERLQFNEDTLWTGEPHEYHHEGAA